MTNKTKLYYLEQVFWFLFFLTWIPVITAYSIFPDFTSLFVDTIAPTNVLLAEQKFILKPYLGTFLICAVICTIIAIFIKKTQYLSIIPFFVISCFIYAFNNKSSFSGAEAVFYTLYILLFLYSIYFFLQNGHLLSASYIIFTLILLIDLMLGFLTEYIMGWEEGLYIFGTIFLLYDISILNFAAFFLISIFIRMSYLIYRDNFFFLTQLANNNAFDLKACRNGAVSLWYPMIVIFLFFTISYYLLFSLYLEPKFVQYLNNKNPALTNVDPDTENYPTGLESAFLSYNSGVLGQLNESSSQAITSATNNVKLKSDGASDVAMSEINNALPGRLPGTEPVGCRFFDILCYVENGIKSAMNSVYQKVKKRQMAVLKQKLVDIEKNIDKSLEDKSALMSEAVSTEINRIANMFQTGIVSAFRSYRHISFLLTVYSLIVLLKTFLIVFARVIFSPKKDHWISGGGLMATFEDGKIKGDFGQITKHEQHLSILKSDERTIFIARGGIGFAGPAPARRNPMGMFAVFSRLWHQKWSMNMIRGNRTGENEQTADIKVNSPAEIVEWRLKDGEAIIFHFSDLIGLSSDLKVDRFVSLSLSTMIFGRIIYYRAEGAGTIFIKTKGAAISSPEEAADSSTSAAKLLNWDLHSRFHVNAELTVRDTFLSDYFILKSKGDNVIWDSDDQRANSWKAGILKFIKSFLLPI